MPRSTKASVTAPVPGPSSSTAPARWGSISAAMARARYLLEGAIAPTASGRASAPRKNRISVFRASARSMGMRLKQGRGSTSFARSPEFLELRQEPFGFRMCSVFARLLELPQQFLLPFVELDRRLDRDLDVEIALHPAAAHHRHAFAAQAELPARLCPLGNIHLRAPTVQCRHFERAAERRADERHRAPAIKIMTVALEDRMRRERDEDVEIARGSAIEARLAFAGEADARAFLDAGGDVDLERAFLLHLARAAAGFARRAHVTAGAAAIGAGAFDGEEALLGADLAHARAGRALLGLGARRRTRAAAAFARDRARDLDLRGAAREGFFERDGEIVAEIGAAILPARAAAAAHELAEEIVEDIGKGRGEVETGRSPGAVLERGMAEAVRGRALLVVFQDVVGFVDFLELHFSAVIVRIAIGMQFHRELAKGRFDLRDRGALLAAEGFVIAALHGVARSTRKAVVIPGAREVRALSPPASRGRKQTVRATLIFLPRCEATVGGAERGTREAEGAFAAEL